MKACVKACVLSIHIFAPNIRVTYGLSMSPHKARAGVGVVWEMGGRRPAVKGSGKPKAAPAPEPVPGTRIALLGRFSVVISQLSKFEDIAIDAVDYSVLLRYSPRPEATESVLQWFRLSKSLEGTSGYILDQLVDLLDGPFICLLPVEVIFPRSSRKQHFHGSTRSEIFFSITFPLFNSSIESINRFALAGDLNR